MSKAQRFAAPLSIALLASIALLHLSTPAMAADGDITLGLGPSWADLPFRGDEGQSGPGGDLWVEYELDRFWGLTAGVGHSYQLSLPAEGDSAGTPGQHITSLWFGALYKLDVATYVPFASLGATAYLANPTLTDKDDQEVHAGARMSLGIDWRRYRSWSLGIEFNLHAFATDLGDYPVYSKALLRMNYHFETF